MASAKNNKSKRSNGKKDIHYPVQTNLLWTSTTGAGLHVLAADKGLSALNRRLYRQNKVYRVKIDVTGDRNQVIDVFRLRDTFMLQRGYQLAMSEWNKSYAEAIKVTNDDVIARWRDFRIDIKPHTGDQLENVYNLRASGTGTTAQAVVIDEYLTSLAYQPDGTSMDFGIKSDSNTFDIISEFNKKGKVQADPNSATSEAAYEELYADLPDAKVARLQGEGNTPPYDADDTHPLDVLEYVGSIYMNSDGTHRTSTGYFDAPLGAVYLFGSGGAIQGIGDGAAQWYKMTVQKGDYKGVNARDFVDVHTME